jgi:hypothetical protein
MREVQARDVEAGSDELMLEAVRRRTERSDQLGAARWAFGYDGHGCSRVGRSCVSLLVVTGSVAF